jgi:GMP synthase (glutamine-hydrolysing)
MSDILILKNVAREGPGLLAGVLDSHGVTYDVVDLDKGEQLPSIVGYKALVVLGGPDSANDTSDKMANELAFVTQAIDNGLPYLGICLGLQVLVHAAGGQVVPGKRKEAGFVDENGEPYAVTFTDAGWEDPLFAGMTSPLPVFQLHGEVVELRPDMKLLGTAPVCENQVVKVGVNAYGIQSHFELTDDMLRVWAAEDPDLTPIGYETLAKDFAAIKDEYTKTGEVLLQNFLRIAGLAH